MAQTPGLRPSCHTSQRSNEVRLWLSVRDYNLGNLSAAGAAEEDRQLVAHQFAATIGKDGRPVGQICPVLLVIAGRRGRRGDTRRVFGGIVRRIAALPVLTTKTA